MLLLQVASLIVAVTSAPAADKVNALPGWKGELPSQHYSGFLDVKAETRVHYWLVESESKPSSDPLVLWFNGGPPCSALVGSFSEMGPFMVNYGKETSDDALYTNPGRWNQNASLLFYENPPGVGFSYNKNEKGYDADDNSQASDNLDALLAFYAKFPEYSSRPLFIAGESYAGVYVPMLAQHIVRHNNELAANPHRKQQHVNLEGILVGNGAIATGDWYEGYLNGLRMEHLYAHGLFGPSLHEHITATCANYTKGVITAECQAKLKLMGNETGVLNQYDIRETCLHGQAPNFVTGDVGGNPQQPLVSGVRSSGSGSSGLELAPGEDPCDLGSSKLIKYLNRKDVQAAIHVTEAIPSTGGNFSDCGPSFDRPVHYTRIPQDERVSVYPELIGKMRILIFNGDQDNCIPYTQDEAWTAGMGLKMLKSWHPWKVSNQVAGYATEYEKDFTFTTVKGAGHLCPLTQPQRAFAMMDRFIQAREL